MIKPLSPFSFGGGHQRVFTDQSEKPVALPIFQCTPHRGSKHLAQGVALGCGVRQPSPRKGKSSTRPNGESGERSRFCPFGAQTISYDHPGRCPGLSTDRPFRPLQLAFRIEKYFSQFVMLFLSIREKLTAMKTFAYK